MGSSARLYSNRERRAAQSPLAWEQTDGDSAGRAETGRTRGSVLQAARPARLPKPVQYHGRRGGRRLPVFPQPACAFTRRRVGREELLLPAATETSRRRPSPARLRARQDGVPSGWSHPQYRRDGDVLPARRCQPGCTAPARSRYLVTNAEPELLRRREVLPLARGDGRLLPVGKYLHRKGICTTVRERLSGLARRERAERYGATLAARDRFRVVCIHPRLSPAGNPDTVTRIGPLGQHNFQLSSEAARIAPSVSK